MFIHYYVMAVLYNVLTFQRSALISEQALYPNIQRMRSTLFPSFLIAFFLILAPVSINAQVRDSLGRIIQPVSPQKVADTNSQGINKSVLAPAPKTIKQPNYYEGKNYAIGIKAGLNFARAINSSGNIISSPTTGLVAGVFFQHGLKILGSRTELNYSRQGFNYDNNGQNGHVTNDYLALLTMTTLTILHRVQLQLGTQEGFLISSKDSNGPGAKGTNPISAFNRFDFGLAGGIEVYPYTGFLVGLRYNLGLTNLIKRPDNNAANFVPFYQQYNGYNVKNGVFQLFIGYQLPL